MILDAFSSKDCSPVGSWLLSVPSSSRCCTSSASRALRFTRAQAMASMFPTTSAVMSATYSGQVSLLSSSAELDAPGAGGLLSGMQPAIWQSTVCISSVSHNVSSSCRARSLREALRASASTDGKYAYQEPLNAVFGDQGCKGSSCEGRA